MVSAVIAMATLKQRKGYSLAKLAETLEPALASGAMIILITAGGGAYGAMLKTAGVGDAVSALAKDLGMSLIVMSFLLSASLKVAQGSSTAAMIAVSSARGSPTEDQCTAAQPAFARKEIHSGERLMSTMI